MADVNVPEDEGPIVVGPMTETDAAVVDYLVSALARGDFAAFNGTVSTKRVDSFPPERRAAHAASRHRAFEQFARRVSPVPAEISVRTGLGETRFIIVCLRVPGPPLAAADLAISRQGSSPIDVNDFVQLDPGLVEQPVDPFDRARIDRVVEALAANDWHAFRQLACHPRIPEDVHRPYFDLFAHKVGHVRRIRCRTNQMGQRHLLVLLAGREPGGRDLSLSMLADGHGEGTTFMTAQLEEQGFDRGAFEKERGRIANLKSPPLPPWKAHPDIPRGSIGWRMGGGETTAMNFQEFFTELSDEDRARFEQAHPEPDEWVGYYRLIRGQTDTGSPSPP